MQLHKIMLDMLKVSESAAIACSKFIGSGKQKLADQEAVNSMRESFNNLDISGTIVIGEGERDKAPMLYIGEKVGKGGVEIDIAVDPLEGTALCADDKQGSISIFAISPKNTMLHAPDLYMQKICVSGTIEGLDLDKPTEFNIKIISKQKNKPINELVAMVLERERHNKLISELRNMGVRVKLFQDGDIAASYLAANNNIDLYVGTGGAPEGVISAAICKILNATFIGKLIVNTEEEINNIKRLNINKNLLNNQLKINDMIKDDVMVILTGVTNGEICEGVKVLENKTETESVVMHYNTKTIQKIKTIKL